MAEELKGLENLCKTVMVGTLTEEHCHYCSSNEVNVEQIFHDCCLKFGIHQGLNQNLGKEVPKFYEEIFIQVCETLVPKKQCTQWERYGYKDHNGRSLYCSKAPEAIEEYVSTQETPKPDQATDTMINQPIGKAVKEADREHATKLEESSQ